jgi:hypothetical protein
MERERGRGRESERQRESEGESKRESLKEFERAKASHTELSLHFFTLC